MRKSNKKVVKLLGNGFPDSKKILEIIGIGEKLKEVIDIYAIFTVPGIRLSIVKLVVFS